MYILPLVIGPKGGSLFVNNNKNYNNNNGIKNWFCSYSFPCDLVSGSISYGSFQDWLAMANYSISIYTSIRKILWSSLFGHIIGGKALEKIVMKGKIKGRRDEVDKTKYYSRWWHGGISIVCENFVTVLLIIEENLLACLVTVQIL